MYDENISTKEFLFNVYLKMEKHINKIINLLNSEKNIKNATEINRLKTNLIEIFDILIYNTNDNKLKENYQYLSFKIISNKIENLNIVLNFSKEVRK